MRVHVRRIGLAALLAMTATMARGDFAAGLAAADRGDFEIAMKEWLPLAENGFPSAQHNVGLLYEHGWGTKEDAGEALMWFWAAAVQGHVDSQYKLGMLYREGKGMTPSPVEAYAWFAVAARGGLELASAEAWAVLDGLKAEEREQALALADVLWDKYGPH
ncbi:MAG: sel1 repeat family protein [Ectothiorhodospiraceae bacterium]|nr:sel1 repeat family protein [Ectothiorhodospiraceae bacterium]